MFGFGFDGKHQGWVGEGRGNGGSEVRPKEKSTRGGNNISVVIPVKRFLELVLDSALPPRCFSHLSPRH